MVRRILLAGIFLVALLILIYALSLQRDEEPPPPLPPETETGPKKGFKFDKYDDQNNHVAIFTGKELRGSEDGPNDMIEPRITIVKDKNVVTVITADWGRVDSRSKKKMGNARLRGNVVMTVTDRKTAEETVLRCEEMVYEGVEERVVIPDAVDVRGETVELTGRQLTTDRTMGMATLEHDVRLVMKKAAEGMLTRLSGETEPSAQPEATKTEPVVITCDGKALFHRNIYRATFEKNVLAVQGENRLAGDHLVVEFEKKPEAEGTAAVAAESFTVSRILMISDRADGVTVKGPDRQGSGDRFDYNGRMGLLVYSGTPCRMTQESEKDTVQLSGSELRFGRRRLVGADEPLPEGMTETSRKLMVTGNPASAESVTRESGEKSVLTGSRLLFDEDAGIVWLSGDANRRADARQGKSHLEAVRIALRRKTDTREESFGAKGPGRLEIARETEPGTAPAPTVVVFGDAMTYLPAEQRASFTGGVEMTERGESSRSRTLDVEFVEGKKPGSREIKRLTASGDVVVKGTREAAAEQLVYEWPRPGEDAFEATLSAKSGASCAIRTEGIYWRAEKIRMTEKTGAGGARAVLAEGEGRGYVQYTPAPKPGAEQETGAFEARYERSGTFDEENRRAEFRGNVQLRRAETTLDGGHVVLDFAREPAKPAPGQKPRERLDVTTVTATDDVKLTMGRAERPMVATATKLVWHRREDRAELRGDPSAGTLAKITGTDVEVEAPVMLAFLRNDRIEHVETTGGGSMTGYTRSRDPETPDKRDPFHVTWKGDGQYRVLESDDPKALREAVGVVKGEAKAVSEDADATADVLTVYLSSGVPGDGTGGSRMEVRKAVASGNARAKMFLPDRKYYRYARGDELEWDRVADRMVVSSKAGDAAMWDESKEWTGERLVLSRSEDRRIEAESTSSRRIVVYEEGVPKVRTDDAKEWKPIY